MDVGLIKGGNANYYTNPSMPTIDGTKPEPVAADEKTKELMGIEDCQTCKNRTYQDGSDDPGVSFKNPTKMDPGLAASAVYSHEREHYTRENAKAESEGREVLSNNIRVFTSVCPECGKTYVSGGETRTVTRKREEQASFAENFYNENVGSYLPKQLNVKA